MHITQLACHVAMLLLLSCVTTLPTRAELPTGVTDDPLLNSRFLLFGSDKLRTRTLRWAVRRGNTDMVASIIYSLRYLDPKDREEAATALRKLTGKRFGDSWFRWMQWQQAQTDIVPFDGFSTFLAGMLKSLDENFIDLVYPGIEHNIRLEEIVWAAPTPSRVYRRSIIQN